MTFADRIANAIATLREAGQGPVLITVHPSREFEAQEVTGYAIKLDPECPIESAYVE